MPGKRTPGPLDRLVVLLLRHADHLKSDISAVAGIAAVALAAVRAMPTLLRIVCALTALIISGLYLAARLADPDAMTAYLASRFRSQVGDPHVDTLLTSATDDLLNEYLRERYPQWYVPQLASTIRRSA